MGTSFIVCPLFFWKDDIVSCLKNIKKNIDEKEKYTITNEELEKIKKRGIELKGLIEDAIRNKEFKKAQKYSYELADSIKFLRKVKKYADKTVK